MKVKTSIKGVLKISTSISFSIFFVFYTICSIFCPPPPEQNTPKNESIRNTTAIILPNTPDIRPPCQEWYAVHPDETQWAISELFTPEGSDRQKWIASMRYMSHKSEQDQHLKPGETVCVKWKIFSNTAK